jgi:F-type H+-transporting ATPase subunit b
MFEINPGLIVWTILTFIAAAVILRAYAWKPLLAALAAREERIRAQIAEASWPVPTNSRNACSEKAAKWASG